MEKSIRTTVIILVLLAGSLCSIGCQGDDYSSFYKGALNYHQRKYVPAKKHLKKFISQHPDTYLAKKAEQYLKRIVKLIRERELKKIYRYSSFNERNTFIHALAFSSRGNKLVLATDNKEFRFYNTQLSYFQAGLPDYTKQQKKDNYSSDKTVWGPGYRFSVPFQNDKVTSIAFSPEGEYLVAGFIDGKVGIWQSPDYKMLKLEQVHKREVCAITFSPDHRWMVTASVDGFLNVWDISGVPVIYQRQKIENKIDTALFCPPSSSGVDYIAVATENYILIGSLKVENVEEGEIEFVTRAVLPNREGERIKKLSFAPGSRILASLHENSEIRIWNLDPKKVESVLLEHGLSDKPLIWTSTKSDWKIWASYWEAGWKFLEHRIRSQDSDFSSMVMGYFGDLLITSQVDRSITFWDVKKEETMKIIHRSGSPIDYLLLSPDSRTLVTASVYKNIFLWNVNVDWKAVF